MDVLSSIGVAEEYLYSAREATYFVKRPGSSAGSSGMAGHSIPKTRVTRPPWLTMPSVRYFNQREPSPLTWLRIWE